MNRSRTTLFKASLIALIVLLLAVAGLFQNGLNKERTALGMNRYVELKGAPPVLALTTVALGGFRGLVANALWIRAIELQDQDRYFEKVQLADWIVKLEPHYAHVWRVQAWDMAYNISVKFTDHNDRWRWVQKGFELIRDQGLYYNPDEATLYHEIAWIFMHKMGQNLDDAHSLYKLSWAREMDVVLGTNYVSLIEPTTDDEKERAKELRERYKLDPAFMKELDGRYGPLEWRLPEAHAIYWAALGLKKTVAKDPMALRRLIYQSMQLAVTRGRVMPDLATGRIILGPNIDMSERANEAYLENLKFDPENFAQVQTSHKNFLRNLPYYFYLEGRTTEAGRWFNYLREQYPGAVPEGMDLEAYSVSKISEYAGETSQEKSTTILKGLVTRYYLDLATDNDDRAATMLRLAQKVRSRYMTEVGKGQIIRMFLPEIPDLLRSVREELLGQQSGVMPEVQAMLRTRLGLPAPTNSVAPVRIPMARPPEAPATTNAAPGKGA